MNYILILSSVLVAHIYGFMLHSMVIPLHPHLLMVAMEMWVQLQDVCNICLQLDMVDFIDIVYQVGVSLVVSMVMHDVVRSNDIR